MILNLKHRGRVCSNFDTRLASPKQVSKSNVSSSLNFCWSKGKNMAYASNAVCHHFDWREEASDMEHLWNISRMCQPKLAAESCVPFDMCSIFLESEKTKYIQILHIYVNPEKSYKFLQIHQKSSTFGLLESWVCLCLRRFISQRSFVLLSFVCYFRNAKVATSLHLGALPAASSAARTSDKTFNISRSSHFGGMA